MEKKNNCWDLIKQKRFDEAYKVADEEYKKTNSERSLGNRAIVLMNLKKYNEALEDYLEFRKINKFNSDWEFTSAGSVYWILEKHLEAIKMWREGLNKPYTDAAGGVQIPCLLYYAAVSLKNEDLEKEAINLLKKKFKTKKTKINFPGSIAGYIIGKIDEENLMNSLSDQTILRERQLCKVTFYIAINCLKAGHIERFYKLLEECRFSNAYLEDEYYLAISELDKKLTKKLAIVKEI